MKVLSILIFAAAILPFAAGAQTTYRWQDPASGQTIFSDQPPPPGARGIEKKTAPGGSDDPQQPYATRVAAEKFPVTLFTAADCGDACASGRKLLNGRGVPFQEKLVQGGSPAMDELKKITGGDALVPVLLVGRQHFRGYDAASWNSLLDLAGYPRTAAFGSKPSGIFAQ